MSLASLWKSQKNELSCKHVQAMVGLAGEGKLRDGGKASEEFREFLSHVPSRLLGRYANECLEQEKFPEASAALQDVINEVGRRLGFAVENGLYRGKSNDIGYDGLWRSDGGDAIIVEVKTTDTYTIDLDTLAHYRKSLATKDRIQLEDSSILIVVGRSDTRSWEAQVRGSPHAWDIRMISVDALLRLVTVKEELENPQVVQKIRQLLRPREYTKVDDIIDLVFSAAEDVRKEEELQAEIASEEESGKKSAPIDFRDRSIARLQVRLKTVLVKRSLALYSSADDKTGVIFLNSRRYDDGKVRRYWFGFRLHHKDAISKYPQGHVAFGCGSPDTIVMIPAKEFIGWLDKFSVTKREDRMFWHVRIVDDKSKLTIDAKAGYEPLDVSSYFLTL